MKKFVLTVIIANAILWFGLTGLTKVANADEYNKAVVAHVIK